MGLNIPYRIREHFLSPKHLNFLLRVSSLSSAVVWTRHQFTVLEKKKREREKEGDINMRIQELERETSDVKVPV